MDDHSMYEMHQTMNLWAIVDDHNAATDDIVDGTMEHEGEIEKLK